MNYLHDRLHAPPHHLDPERGTRRDDLGPALRVIGYRPRVTLAFHVEPGRVTIDRVLYGGRDLPSAITRK